MRLPAILRLRLRSLLHPRRFDAELEEELRGHIEREAAAAGEPEAWRRFAPGGGLDAVRDACREQRGWTGLENFLQDARRATRRLARAPVFSLSAIFVLALGIAAASAIFSLCDAVLLRPLPGVAAGAPLVHLERWDGNSLLGDMSYPDFLDYRAQSRTVAGLAASSNTDLNIAASGLAEVVGGELVSADYFPTLGVHPELGRLLSADIPTGQNRVAVISDQLWHSAFASDSKIVGRTVTINRLPFTVVGVAAAGFRGVYQQWASDVWAPISNQPQLDPMNDCFTNRNCGWITAFGRLAPGTTLAGARAEFATISARIAATHKLEAGRRAEVVAGLGAWSDDRANQSGFLALLLAATLLLLAMASASVGSLFLARMGARQREVATQLALGAGRGRVARQFLLEGGLTAAAGAVLGVTFAPALARGLLHLAPTAPENLQIVWDFRVVVFSLAVTFASALGMSLAPAWLASRAGLQSSLRQGGGAGIRHSTQRVLLSLQIALSLLLLIAASLAGRTLQAATAGVVPPDSGHVWMAYLNTNQQNLSRVQAGEVFHALQRRLSAQPGVESAVLAACIPPSPCNRGPVFVAGTEPSLDVMRYREFSYATRPDINWVGPGFFHLFAMPLIAGRDFGPADQLNSPKVCVVNQSLAAALWPHESALGRQISWPSYYRIGRHEDFTVVGILADRRTDSLVEAAKQQMYVPETQVPFPSLWLAVRSTASTGAVQSLVQSQLAALDPGLPLTHVRTLADQVRRSVWQPLAIASLAGSFGLLAALLAAIGLFGTLTQFVLERRREFGVRLALGATPQGLVRMVVRDAARPIAAGLALGLAAALLLTPRLAPWLFGIRVTDAVSWLAALLLLAAVALASAFAAARRAAAVAPAEALRAE